MDKKERQRHKVSAPINHIRTFRNRIFHHEPIAWNLIQLEKIHQDMLIVMSWINKDLPSLIAPLDRITSVLEVTRTTIYENKTLKS